MQIRRSFLLGLVTLSLATGAVGAGQTEEPSAWVDPRADPSTLDRLASVQRDLRTNYPDTFGGLWIDRSGRTVVASVNGDPRIKSALDSLGEETDILEVRFSERELDAVHEQLRAEAGEAFKLGGAQVATIGTDVIGNKVDVVLVSPSPEAVTTIHALAHPAVNLSTTGQLVSGACTVSNCPNPLKAGLKGYRSGTFACMTGFIFRVSVGPKYYWSTAGHCNSGTGGWRTPSETWQHPAGVNRGAVSYMGWYNNSVADVALFEITSTQKSNKLCTGTSCYVVSITSRQSASGEEVIGQTMCAQRQTGLSCGVLVSTNITINICKPNSSDCRTMLWQRRATFQPNAGDSGGPVYAGSKAIGMIAATYPNSTDAIYSHVNNVEWQASVQTQLIP